MYPIKFENLYFNKIWGGRDLESFRDNLPEGLIGESWDIASHNNGTVIIKNGEFKGKSLKELFVSNEENIFGTKIDKERFPLLLKLINSKEALSVQVHPNDEYAKKNENDMGKSEAWYVLDAEEDSYLIIGTKNSSKKELKKYITEDNIMESLNKIPVKKGDVFHIKSGLIHAIGPGLIIYEIQQNSDTTYRLYDYGRDRDIHIEKSLDVIDFSLKPSKKEGIYYIENDATVIYLILDKYFVLKKYIINGCFNERSSEERFFIYTVVEGNGEIIYNKGSLNLTMGESIIIPSNLGNYQLKGNFTLLKSYVPDVEKEKKHLLKKII